MLLASSIPPLIVFGGVVETMMKQRFKYALAVQYSLLQEGKYANTILIDGENSLTGIQAYILPDEDIQHIGSLLGCVITLQEVFDLNNLPGPTPPMYISLQATPCTKTGAMITLEHLFQSIPEETGKQ